MRKYIEIFKYSIKQKTAFITSYIASLVSFGILMFVFNELWDYILQGKLVVGFTKKQLIWYITITELVTLSTDRSYHKISDMVKNGDIANLLIKPIDFIKYQFMEDLSAIIKLIINSIFAVVLGLVLTGPIEITVINLVFTIISVMIGIITGILIQIFVGVIAVFTEENKGFWLIIQKLSFLLVFTPIEFYSGIIQKIFYCLPTTYMVYTPARILIGANIKLSVILIVAEIISLIFWYMLIKILYARGVKKINVNGG